MDENEQKQIKNIITNLEFATEKFNDLNSHMVSSIKLHEYKRFQDAMTLIKDAKKIAYDLFNKV